MTPFLSAGPKTDRTGAVTAGLMTKFAAPSAVSAAPVQSVHDAADVAANFADPFGRREYPIHSPASAWASAAFYHSTGSTDPEVAGRIKEACYRHRLFGEWERLEAAARPAAVKTAAASAYALPAAGRYPIDTPEQIKSASDYFHVHAAAFPDADRREFARNTARAANRYPDLLPAERLHRLQAEAGLGRLSGSWKSAFEVRIRLAEIENQTDLASALKSASASPPEDTAAAAALLRRVDRVNGWRVADPLDVIVDLTPAKAAADLSTVVKSADGSWYRRADLARVPDSTVAVLFGAPPVASGEYRAGLLKSAETAKAFQAVLADHGVRPVREARARVDWARLAAAETGSGQ